MEIQLSPSLVLSDEHAWCRAGMPVLVLSDGTTDSQTFEAADPVEFGCATQPAALWVRLLGDFKRDPAERQLCRRFLASWPEGPQLG